MLEHFFSKAKFILSAPEIKFLPPDSGYEVAFLGRSNAGKSSTINAITRQKGLAKTSKTPGRTAALNIFAFDDSKRLVDVPGFGYAKVPTKTRDKWHVLINEYLARRQCLRGIVLVMDIRHPLTPIDMEVISWLENNDLAAHILLSKSDKLKYGARKKVFLQISGQFNNNISVSLFSAKTKEGLIELNSVLARWYQL